MKSGKHRSQEIQGMRRKANKKIRKQIRKQIRKNNRPKL